MKRLFLFFTVLSVFLLSTCVIPSRQEKTESAKNTEASVGTTKKEMGMYKKISAKEAYDMMSAGALPLWTCARGRNTTRGKSKALFLSRMKQ